MRKQTETTETKAAIPSKTALMIAISQNYDVSKIFLLELPYFSGKCEFKIFTLQARRKGGGSRGSNEPLWRTVMED